MITADIVFKDLKSHSNPAEAEKSLRYFKAGKGEYAEGDKFLGMQLKDVNDIIKKYVKDISLAEIEKLLQNPWHEARTTAVSMLVKKYEKADEKKKKLLTFILKIQNILIIGIWLIFLPLKLLGLMFMKLVRLIYYISLPNQNIFGLREFLYLLVSIL